MSAAAAVENGTAPLMGNGGSKKEVSVNRTVSGVGAIPPHYGAIRERTKSMGSMSGKSDVYEEGAKTDALGSKTINIWGSMTLNINNLSGPGMLALPIVFQQAGWLLPAIALVFFTGLASFSATMMSEAMALLPGNRRFGKRVEFSTVVERYYGRTAYIICQLVYSCSLQTLNIASILVCTKVMDEFFVFAAGKSYAFSFNKPFGFVSTTDLAEPFSANGFVITLGYLSCLIPCMPMGFINLDENIKFQYFSLFILVTMFFEFCAQFIVLPMNPAYLPVIGSDLSTVVGTIMFNYTFVVTVPSWVNEKKDNVSLNKAVWYSAFISTFSYFAMGVLGALVFPPFVKSDILQTLVSRPNATMLTKISSYVFSFGVIGLGIPLFSVMVRYNLYVGKVFGKVGSAFFGAVFPWLVSFLLYQGDGFANFVTWASLFVNSFINFGLPMVLYVTARKRLAERLANCDEDHLLFHADEDTIDDDVVAHAKANGVDPEDDTYDYTGLNVLPKWLRSFQRATTFAYFVLCTVVVLTVLAIVIQFYQVAKTGNGD